MIELIKLCLSFLAAMLRSRATLQAENLALRNQLCVYQRSIKKPKVQPADRILWRLLVGTWTGWIQNPKSKIENPKSPRLSRFVSALLLLALAAAPLCHALEAGSAKVEITPPLDTPLNGYFDRLGRGALSVHDPVWARCLYLDDGETRLFLLTADLCIINSELRQRVLELAPGVAPKENIILAATHTHSAQGAMIKSLVFRSISGRFMPEILETTAQRFADAMQAAYDGRKRASMGYTTIVQDDLTKNRRQDGGPIDRQIGVIRVEDSDGAPVAILANLAAHPTTVGNPNWLSVSADYVGCYYNELERLAGAPCVAMFANGAEGNQTCANPENAEGWARTESIGRLLAERVNDASDAIACGAAKLHVGFAEPNLPPTLSDRLVPAKTVLHTLEINDLLVTFLPGEACIEIALELRKQALARGYAAQFTVDLADDYLMYFVPRAFYSHLNYESAMNFYGPRMQDWFTREFSRLATRGEPELEPAPVEPVPIEPLGAGALVRLNGTPHEIGAQRGAAFRDAVRAAFARDVVAPCDTGALIPDTGLWRYAPSFLDKTTLALPRLAIGVRPMLAGLSSDTFDEIEGLAEGAGLPFDAAWLLQCAPTLLARRNVGDLYRSPFCTMFAVLGDRAGADDLLVGRNLDWPVKELPVVFDVRPERGHRFVQIGFPWNVGVFTGMNDAGLIVCIERVESLGEPSIEGPPVELVLRAVLQDADDLSEALIRLTAASHLRGYHVLAASPATPSARVLEFGETCVEREPEKGLLLGVDPSDSSDPNATERYRRLSELVQDQRIVSADEIGQFLQDRVPGVPPSARIFNDRTRYSVVFEPKARRLRVAFPKEDGTPGGYASVSLGEGAR